MRHLSSLFLIFFALISFSQVILIPNAYPQDNPLVITPGLQFDYAHKLFKDKDFETASIEFKRFVHFFPDNPKIKKARFHIAECLYHQGKYYDAAKAFNTIIMNNEQMGAAYFYQSDAFLKLGNTGPAQIILQNYLLLTDNQKERDRIYFKLGQLHLAQAKLGKQAALSEAKTSFAKISESGKIQFNTDQYLDLITSAQNAPRKNPTAAGIFSIVPGGGFLYCERYKDAFITFLLNTGLIIAAWQAYDNDNEALAGVIGFVETGFYTGNIYGSISSAHKYNRAQTLRILNKEFSISSTIQPDFSGYSFLLNYEF